MRSIKNTVLRVRKLEIPVGIASARRESKLGLRLLHRTCKTPVTQRAWCVKHDRALDPDKDTVKGFEISDGRYLALTDAEIAETAGSDSDAIEIRSFAPASTVPAQLVLSVYYLMPSKLPVCAREYATLQQTLEETGLVGLCKFHWRTDWTAAISALPETRALLLTRLAPLGELVNHHPIDQQLLATWPTDSEIERGRRMVAGMQRKRPPANALTATSNDKLRTLIEQKLNGDGTLESTLRRSVTRTKRHQRDTARAT